MYFIENDSIVVTPFSLPFIEIRIDDILNMYSDSNPDLLLSHKADIAFYTTCVTFFTHHIRYKPICLLN